MTVILHGKNNIIIYVKIYHRKIGVLKFIKDYVKFDILKMVHSSIVLPHIEYAFIVWGRCPNMINNDRMSKLQKGVARVILRCEIGDISCKDLFNTMNWVPFYDRVTFEICLMMYKVNANLVPQYLQSLTPVTSVHNHNT